MANEKVVFKRGTTANLPTTKTPGTVLLDVSTGAMYVDDTSSSRVQVKDTTKLGKSENAVSASKLATARNINGMSFNGEANRVNYGTCSTAAATVAKTVACTGFALVTGAEITVKFTVTNTASSPTLNVNSTGAKPIYYNGSAISAGHLAANRTYTFRYNGTQWDLVGAVVYTHPATAGNKHIPSGGSSGQILRWSAAGTAVWGDDNNTDINVMQHTTNAANYRPLVFGYTNSSDPDELIKENGSSVTGQVYVTNKIYSKPATGELYASGLSLLTDSANGSLKQASTDNNVTHTFPSVSGTVLNTGNYLDYKGHLRQTVMNQPSSTPTSTPWFKVASTTITNTSTHSFLTLAVSSGMVGNQVGILHVKIATGNTVGTNMSATAKWLNPTGIELGDFVITYTETENTSVEYELWCKLDKQWRTYIFSVINEGTRTTADICWDLEENKTAGVATYGTPTGVVESSYITNDSPSKMTENTVDSEQYIFFNDSTVEGTLGYDPSFTYNPSKNTVTATKFIGSGAGLTSLNASNLSSGTVPLARIPTGTSSTTVALGNHTHSNYYSSSTSRTANTVLAGPNGSDGTASFRKLVAADLPTSGATAGTYGESASKTATHGGTISIPKITVDNKGRVTSASSITITLPSDNNTDVNVKQYTTNATNYRPLVFGYTNSSNPDDLIKEDGSSVTGQVYVTNKIYSKPATGELYASGLSLLTDSANGSLKQASTDNNVTHTFPSVSGTVLNTGNYLNYKGHLRQNVMNQSSSTPTSTPWFKVASATITDTSTHIFLTLAVSSGMIGNQAGILHVKVATGTTVGTNMSATAKWLNPTGIELGDFVLTYTETANTSVKYELWCKLTSQWRTYIFSVINEGTRTTADIRWTLEENTTAGVATYGTPTGVVESSYIADVPSTVLPVVPIEKGGTGATDAATARTNLGITPANIGAAASSHGRHVEFSTTAPKANGTAAVGTATTVSRSDHVHPLQTTVSGNAGTATKLATARTIDGFSFDGSASINHYATCSTAAATVAKVATINTGTFTLTTGATVYVKFTNANTATSATLNVNSTGAKPIFHNGAAISASSYIKAGGVYQFVYDGTNWVINPGVEYTHPTSAGNKHIPSGGSSGQFLKWSTAGTAAWSSVTKSDVGLGNVENKSSATIRGELTKANVTTALGYTPPTTDTNTEVNMVSSASKSYLLGTTTAPTTDTVGVTSTAHEAVYATNGTLYATKFSGSGASLTSLNASNLSSGTVPIARIPTGTSSTTVALGNHTHSNYYSSSTSRTANTVLAGPNGSDGTASFRKLVAADLPTSGVTAASYGPSANTTPTHGGTFSVPYVTVDKYGRVTSASSITVTLPSDNNTDTKVTSTTTNPTSAKSYYPTFVTGATTGGVSINNGLQYQSLEGTASADGYGILKLGNSTASGTAANKYGRIDIYSIGTSYGSIKQASTNSAVTHWLPDVGGTILNSGNYLDYKGHLRQNVMNQSSSTPTETPWFKIASMTLEGTSSHAFGTFAIANGMSAGDVGILHVKVATGNTAGTNLSATAKWISKTRIDPSTFVLTYTETANTSVKYELWCKLTNQWRTYISSIINEGARTQAKIVWELSEDTTAGSATYGTPTGFSESSHTIDEGAMITTSNSANSEQTIFFNDSTVDGTLGYDSSLVFNPSTNTIYVTNPGGTRRSGYGGNGMSIRADSSTTWACGVNYYTSDGATQIGAIGAYGVANATEAGYLYMGKTYSNPWLKVAEDQITGYADMVISKATPKLTLNSGGSTPPTIELKRNGSSWRVMNESGAFVLKCDWDAENSTTTDWWQALKISTTGAISGNGSGLTNLNASNVASGTLSSDRLPVVPEGKGGTGASSYLGAQYNILNSMSKGVTSDIEDSTEFIFKLATTSSSNGFACSRKATAVWTYIKTKADATYQPLKKKTVTLPATAGWYRIASSWEGINRCQGIFTIEATVSGRHTTATFTAQSSYGRATSTSVIVLTASHYANAAITKARIVYHTTYSGHYAYIEVYNAAATATKVTTNIDSSIGWQLIDVVAGSVPSGYSNSEVTLSNRSTGTLALTSEANKVLQADLNVRHDPETNTTNNAGLRLPLAIGSKNTNPNNNFKDGEGEREINIVSGNYGINLTGLAWIETNTTSGNNGMPNIPYATICSTGFRVTDNDIGGFFGNATTATSLKNQPTINGVTFAGNSNITLSDEIWGEGTGYSAIIDSTTPVSGYDLLWVETDWGHHMVRAKLNQHYYRTYATTPWPSIDGTNNSIIGTIDIFVESDTSVKATVSNVQIQGSNTTVSAIKSTLTATIFRIIGIRLM